MLQNTNTELTSGRISCRAACEQDPGQHTGDGCIKIYEELRMVYPFMCLPTGWCVRGHLAVTWGWAPGCLWSDFSPEGLSHQLGLHTAQHQKRFNYDQFFFFFLCLFPFLQLPLPKLWMKHAPSLLFSSAPLHFSVLHRKGLLFSLFALGHLSV